MDDPAPEWAATEVLLEQARNGDSRAFDRLFGQHRAGLKTFFSLRFDPGLAARLDPSDVVQETQLEAFHRLEDFLKRRPMPFELWLRKTAYERLLKIRRQHVRTARRSVTREV